ncbi:MAG TPA: hypothetical protein VIY48_14010 [Candidatus Paceibacterota bacterium]
MKNDVVRAAAEADLETFIRLIHPHRVLGQIHSDICKWWTRAGAKTHQILLLPRDHQKSALVAYRVAWAITKNPALRVLYISSTSNLATKQLKFIKDILTSRIYTFYWPDMVNADEAKREKWTETEISVDHPKRKEETVRDPTIFTAGLTTNVVGLHCDIAVLDDVVVNDTAYTAEGRARLETQYSFLASIEGSDGLEWVVGTRYHPKDLYATQIAMKYDEFNDQGEIVHSEPLYEMKEYPVEDKGDGTGKFLWPHQMREDGKWFGFNRVILARKKSQYINKVQFRAQYYNDPNDIENASIKREYFQYYDKNFLTRMNGQWYYKGSKLNLFAAVDFAYTENKDSDFTAIVIVGVDHAQNYFILDIDRFKTGETSEYFKHILRLHQKWDFRKLKAEVTAAQETIVKALKNDYIRTYGLALAVEDFRPNRSAGNKRERIKAILEPRYSNRQVWHFQGGNCQELEEELVLEHPVHDDIKDCLATCIDSCIAPSYRRITQVSPEKPLQFHTRFGGVL